MACCPSCQSENMVLCSTRELSSLRYNWQTTNLPRKAVLGGGRVTPREKYRKERRLKRGLKHWTTPNSCEATAGVSHRIISQWHAFTVDHALSCSTGGNFSHIDPAFPCFIFLSPHTIMVIVANFLYIHPPSTKIHHKHQQGKEASSYSQTKLSGLIWTTRREISYWRDN